MKDAVVVYPHQMFKESPALAGAKSGGYPVYLVEEPLFLTRNPIHRQRLLLHKLSMDAYEHDLTEEGFTVERLTIQEHPKTTDVFAKLQADGVERIHIVDTTDDYLEQAIAQSGLMRIWYESPLFLLPKAEAVERYRNSKQFMANFYKTIRQDLGILVDENGDPAGGKWSFDEDNRQKIPKDTPLPEDISLFSNDETTQAGAWVGSIDAEKYGECQCWVPYTHEGAQRFLTEFLHTRLADFGPYEDAMSTKRIRLWHSTLSPLLNTGLLTPKQVLSATIEYATEHEVPLNSLEGFIRQLIGWREFIRASYEQHGREMRSSDYFGHARPLRDGMWNAKTGIEPLDHVIQTALTYGYTHHIERLMVVGNFLLLTETSPTDVYRWFMGMYIDAYDWVMVPNVYGMSQFADGGSFATKPYISGANYLKKMSDFPGGEWGEIWTALYWRFIAQHRTVFEENPRLSMMPKLLDRMTKETKEAHLKRAEKFLDS